MKIRYFLALLGLFSGSTQIYTQSHAKSEKNFLNRPSVLEHTTLASCNTEPKVTNRNRENAINYAVEIRRKFIRAIKAKDITTIKQILKAHPFNRSRFLQDGLHQAARHANIELMDFFIKQGASITSRSSNGWRVIHSAVRSGSAEAVNYVLDRGADINARTWWCQVSPLFIAIENHNFALVKLLVERGADLNITSYWFGYTVVHEAIYRDDAVILKYLLDAAPHLLNQRTLQEKTPLMLAVQFDRVNLVPLIADYKPAFAVASHPTLA